jgi:hypothetical protein
MTAPPANVRSRRDRRPLVEELLDAARAGDRSRFDRLFDLWFEGVLAGAHRALQDRTLAHERTGVLLRRALATRLAPSAGAGDQEADRGASVEPAAARSAEAPPSDGA